MFDENVIGYRHKQGGDFEYRTQCTKCADDFVAWLIESNGELLYWNLASVCIETEVCC